MSQDLMLVSDVQARSALRGTRVRFRLLSPYGAWLGRGTLRVLRLKMHDDCADLTVGYESYERLER